MRPLKDLFIRFVLPMSYVMWIAGCNCGGPTLISEENLVKVHGEIADCDCWHTISDYSEFDHGYYTMELKFKDGRTWTGNTLDRDWCDRHWLKTGRFFVIEYDKETKFINSMEVIPMQKPVKVEL